MAPVLQTRTERRGNREATGAAVTGAGAVTAGTGLVGGGIPGFRADSDTIRNLRQGGWRQRTGAALSSGRGGIFGYRIDAHQGALDRFRGDEKHFANDRVSRTNAFLRGRGSGKIKPEVDIIRHLKRGRRASNVALVGGSALAVGGARHGRGGQVAKAQSDTQRYHGALLGTGGTAAAASIAGERILRGQSRRWAEREAQSLRAAEKIIPNLKTTISDSGAVKNPKVLSGKSKVQAEEAGRHRGAAAQEKYFSRVYGGTANAVRRIRNPALATAAVGGAGLALSARNADTTGRRQLAKSAGDEMPYKSDRQRRFMHARHPGIAQRWDAEIRESRKQSAYGSGGSHGRKVDVDKRGAAVAATAHRVAPRTFNRAAGTGNVRLVNSRQQQDVFPLRGVVAPGRPAFVGQAPGSSAGRQASAVRGPASRPGVVRAPQTRQEQARAYGQGRAEALRRIQADNAPKPRTTQEAVRGYGGARAAALRQTQAPASPEAVAQTPFLRRRSTLATGGAGLAAGVYGSSQLEVTRKRDSYRGPDYVQGAGVAGVGGVIGLTGAGNYYSARLDRNIAQGEGERMVARGRQHYVPYEGARVLEELKQAKRKMRSGKHTALAGLGVTGLGGAMMVADRRAQAARRQQRLARKDTASKAYRSNDPEAARQRRLGAGVATTGILGTALAGAGGRRAFKLTRSLRSAPMQLPPRSQLTEDQARALETLKHGRVVVADRKALALVGGGSATGLGSAALARHARDDRNRRWT